VRLQKEEEEDKKGKGKGKGDEDEPEEPHYMRAALAQAIRYRSNKKARTAIENESFLRAFDDPFNVLTDLHDQLEHKREAERCASPPKTCRLCVCGWCVRSCVRVLC
jgi:hypothetical protein